MNGSVPASTVWWRRRYAATRHRVNILNQGLTPVDAVALLVVGLVAGVVNAIVGSGSLLTFPTLLAIGYPPVVANVTNTVGMVLGNLSGVVGYRRELAGQRRRILELAGFAIAGGLIGAVLLLALPQSVFRRVVPVLIVIALVLVLLQPRLSACMARRRARAGSSWALRGAVSATSVYGGYFGAAMGVIYIAIFSVFIEDDLQRMNALKNVISAIVNGVAAVVFVFFAHVEWPAAALLAASGVVGGQIGAAIGRRLPDGALRVAIVIAGVAAVIKLVF
jgi:uncharacterized membrane protein YfcA